MTDQVRTALEAQAAMFSATTASILSGACIERIRMSGFRWS